MSLETLTIVFNLVAIGTVISVCQATLLVLSRLEQCSIGYRDVCISSAVAAICLAIGNVVWPVLLPVVLAFAAINALRVAISRAPCPSSESRQPTERSECVLSNQDA